MENYYYEATEADMNFREFGRFIRDEVFKFGITKAAEFLKDKLDKSGLCITITNPNYGSTQLMYHLVDNSRPYDEFRNSRERYDICMRVSMDRNNSSNGYIANIVRSALN